MELINDVKSTSDLLALASESSSEGEALAASDRDSTHRTHALAHTIDKIGESVKM